MADLVPFLIPPNGERSKGSKQTIWQRPAQNKTQCPTKIASTTRKKEKTSGVVRSGIRDFLEADIEDLIWGRSSQRGRVKDYRRSRK